MKSVLRAFVLSFLHSFPIFLAAQNLVPNPSFECGGDHCYPNQSASSYSFYACDWSCPNTGTSDVFSTINQNKECWASMPSFNYNYNYYIGSRLPRSGNRFAGIYAYSGNYYEVCYREYLQTKLIEPLQQGEVYCTEAFVSRAQAPYFASNGLGFYFGTSRVEQNNYANLTLEPQVVHDQIITDTTNWIKIAGTFKASSAADYLIFGNFYDDTKTQSVTTKTIPGTYYQYAYYFVDDVRVEKMPYDNFLFTGATTVCEGDSIEILADAGVKNVSWTPLQDTTRIISHSPWLRDKPLLTSSYRVTATGCDKKIIDTVTVHVISRPNVDLGKDTTVCHGTKLMLDAGDHAIYNWQDNSTSRYFSVVQPGMFSVQVANNYGCLALDSIRVNYNYFPAVNLGKDLLVCDDNYPTLHAGRGYDRYEWSTGAVDSVYTPSASGKYWVKVENECGNANDTINIHSPSDLFIPNVLTLNNDDTLNRYLIINGISSDLTGSVIIYNRWGQPVYQNNNYQNNWPADPDNVPTETYYYIWGYAHCPQRKGWVKVIK